MRPYPIDLGFEKARRDNPEQLAEMYEHFYPKVLKYMYYRAGEHIAEDLTAEVFLRVVRGIKKQKGSFVAWLYTIARNVVADHFRSAKVRHEISLDDQMIQSLHINEGAKGRVAIKVDLSNAIQELTDSQQEFITLKFIQGLSNQEIEQITGRKQEAIRGLQFRSLSALRAILTSKGDTNHG